MRGEQQPMQHHPVMVQTTKAVCVCSGESKVALHQQGQGRFWSKYHLGQHQAVRRGLGGQTSRANLVIHSFIKSFIMFRLLCGVLERE